MGNKLKKFSFNFRLTPRSGWGIFTTMTILNSPTKGTWLGSPPTPVTPKQAPSVQNRRIWQSSSYPKNYFHPQTNRIPIWMATSAIPDKISILNDYQQITGTDLKVCWSLASWPSVYPWSVVCGLLEGQFPKQSEVCYYEGPTGQGCKRCFQRSSHKVRWFEPIKHFSQLYFF